MPALRGVVRAVKMYFAGIESQKRILDAVKPPNVLFSFLGANSVAMNYAKSESCKSYLLDSGAFTFLYGAGKKVDFDSYVDQYIDFINENKILLFFEMDVDTIVGLPKVEAYRRRIENKTGKRPIVVFHKERGKEYFLDMCKNYPYVAIGGIAGRGNQRREYLPYFRWFIDKAHEHGAKIHGLGFTDFAHIRDLPFDSVDSTSWLCGGRYGNMYEIRDGIPRQRTLRKAGYKVDGDKLNEHNMRIIQAYCDAL